MQLGLTRRECNAKSRSARELAARRRERKQALCARCYCDDDDNKTIGEHHLAQPCAHAKTVAKCQ
jgi:hypothetical protein